MYKVSLAARRRFFIHIWLRLNPQSQYEILHLKLTETLQF